MEHRPTKEMVSDINTKPLQGALFRKFRDAILNVLPEDGSASVLNTEIHRSVLRVEDKKKAGEGQAWSQVATGGNKWKAVIEF